MINTYTWFHKLNITPSNICETPNITDIFFLNEFVYIILFSANCHAYNKYRGQHERHTKKLDKNHVHRYHKNKFTFIISG